MAVGARTDADIQRDILEQLQADARIDASDIQVQVAAGQVVLDGAVPHYRARRTAEDAAGAIPGVLSTENNLVVKHPRAGELPTDQELKIRVESLLRWQPDLEAAGIDVSIHGGWVTLRGRVDAHWKRSRAERLIFYIGGIVGLDNQIVVRPAEEPGEDGQVERQLRAALRRNAWIDAGRLQVQVREGVATVTGSVPTLAVYRQVQETLESLAAGIREIENDVLVERTGPPGAAESSVRRVGRREEPSSWPR